tara:strand:- start:1153 stop:1812 length:660 start_codon:yes stop_codon:yes gene_type:complete
MSWSEEVAFIFIQILQDPEIIRYLLSITKPIHNNYLFEEARLFHESLRMTREKRWAQTKELSKQRKFHEMNNRVPITCSLPFNNIEWRSSCELVQSIRYFIPGFIRKKYPVRESEGSLICEDIDLELPLKVKCVNLIFNDDIESGEFRGYFSREEIRGHLDDFEIYEDWDNSIWEETPPQETPYLLIEIWCDGVVRSGYSKRTFNFRDNTDLYIEELMN